MVRIFFHGRLFAKSLAVPSKIEDHDFKAIFFLSATRPNLRERNSSNLKINTYMHEYNPCLQC